MKEVLEDRLKNSQFAQSDFNVSLKIDGIQIGVAAKGGKLEFEIMDSKVENGHARIELYPKGLAKLIAGQFSANELLNLGYIRLDEESDIAILAVLFPKHLPYIFETDDN